MKRVNHGIDFVIVFSEWKGYKLFNTRLSSRQEKHLTPIKASLKFSQACHLVFCSLYNIGSKSSLLQHTPYYLPSIIRFDIYDCHVMKFIHPFDVRAKNLFVLFSSRKPCHGVDIKLPFFMSGDSKSHLISSSIFRKGWVYTYYDFTSIRQAISIAY